MTDPRSSPVQVVFDTHCILCSGWVHFLLRHEADDRLHFVGAWSRPGLALAARHGMTAEDLQKTFLVVEDDTGLTRSDAALALLSQLGAPWRWLRLSRIVPRPLRDLVYDLIARNRYRWFGRTDTCLVPTPDQRARFTLD